ncbi:MAG: hypothetical protein ACSHYF_16650 [Verrucomicrobiaceae bacterium]
MVEETTLLFFLVHSPVYDKEINPDAFFAQNFFCGILGRFLAFEASVSGEISLSGADGRILIELWIICTPSDLAQNVFHA